MAGVILRRNLKVTALVAADDAIASGVIARLRHEGKRVPDDFSVIGHGNLMFGDIFDPPVSTIDPQTNRLFEEAADAVSTLLRAEGRVETREILVNPLLLKRASTAAARAVS